MDRRIRDTAGRSFVLTHDTCRDSDYYANRSDVKAVVKQLKRNRCAPRGLRILRHSNDDMLLEVADSDCFLIDGCLCLGCHPFSLEKSKIIIRWALAKTKKGTRK